MAKKKPKSNDDYGRRLREDVYMRHFRWLGWAVILVPLDLIEDRGVARMFFGTWYRFKPEEVIELRARRLTMEGEEERTWWVLAIPEAAIDRPDRVSVDVDLARAAAKRKKAKKKR